MTSTPLIFPGHDVCILLSALPDKLAPPDSSPIIFCFTGNLELLLGSMIGSELDLSLVFKYASIFFSGANVGSFGLPFDANFFKLLCNNCLAI